MFLEQDIADEWIFLDKVISHYCKDLIGGSVYADKMFLVKPLYLSDITIAVENDDFQHPSTFSQIIIAYLQIRECLST
jgi:hypothetical protein